MSEITRYEVNGVAYATEAEAIAAQNKAKEAVVEQSGINKALLEAKNDEISITPEDQAVLQGVLDELEKIKINVISERSAKTESSGETTEITEAQNNVAVYSAQLDYLRNILEENKTELKNKQEKLAKEENTKEELQYKIKEEMAKAEDKQKTINMLKEKIAKKEKKLASTDPTSKEYSDITEELVLYNSQVGTLANERSEILSNISALSNKLETQTQTVTSLHTSIESLNNIIGALESQITNVQASQEAATAALQTLTSAQAIAAAQTTSQTTGTGEATTVPASISNMISQTEWDLVGKNNLNITEKLADGSPRYIFAKGQQDNTYHIYDMGKNGASLVRQYSPSQGFDIIKSGNGYLRNLKDATEGNGKECFYMEDCDKLASFNACYCTCSPLSLDIDGNGVGTVNSIIDYDIDGDGQMDKINDSADAILVFDKDGNGISGENGSEAFGNNTDLNGDGVKDGFKNGFEALKELAIQSGLIDGVNDSVLDEKDIKLLEEKYGLKLKVGGYNSEAQSLLDYGITEIRISKTNETTLTDNFDNLGNQLMQQQGATFVINGEEREYADIWHKKQNADTAERIKTSPHAARTEAALSSTISFLMAKNKSYTIRNIIQQTKMDNLSELAPENIKSQKVKDELQKTIANNAEKAKKAKEAKKKEEEDKEKEEEDMKLDE